MVNMNKNIKRTIIPIIISMFASACTTVGTHDRDTFSSTDFGPREELRICLLTDEGITERSARKLFSRVGDELSDFGIDVTIPWVKPWKRPAFLMDGILEDVALRPLEPPCDRLMAIVGRNVGDFITSWFSPEVLGAVETVTYTRGYVVGKTATLNQLFQRPAEVAVHESYHLLGCVHGLSLAECYPHIKQLKASARSNRNSGNDFFPGTSLYRQPIASRGETGKRIRNIYVNIKNNQLAAHYPQCEKSHPHASCR